MSTAIFAFGVLAALARLLMPRRPVPVRVEATKRSARNALR